MSVVLLTDAATGSTAQIATHLGLNCFDFQAVAGNGQTVSVIEADANFTTDASSFSRNGIPLLFPFPNRIEGGRYSWEGKDYHLPESLVGYEGQGNAIHGFVLDRPWRIIEQTESSVTGAFQLSVDDPDRCHLWPTDAEIQIRYSLNGTTLRSDITVRNPSDKPLPWGFGTHAYFRLPMAEGSSADNCTVYAPAEKQWVLENCLPTGTLKTPATGDQLTAAPKYGDLKLDDVYTNVQSEDGMVTCRIVDEDSGLQIVQTCDDSFREIVAFTPPWTTAVCLEPYTCTTNAINLQQKGVDAGLKVLAPGAEWKGWIEISAGPVVC